MTESGPKRKRVMVEQRSLDLVRKRTSEIRENGCKISESELISEVLAEFLKKDQSRFISKITRKYFDHRRRLHELLSEKKTNAEILDELCKMTAPMSSRKGGDT